MDKIEKSVLHNPILWADVPDVDIIRVEESFYMISTSMKYTLDHFMGYRIGLFNYATKEIGGYADFEHFHYERYPI